MLNLILTVQTWSEWLNYWMNQSANDWHSISWAVDNNPILIGLHLISTTILAVTFLFVAGGVIYQSYIGGFFNDEHKLVCTLFIGFFIMAALTFIMDGVVVFIPIFCVYGSIKALATLFALLTAISYIKFLPTLNEYPTPKQYLELEKQKTELERKQTLLDEHIKVWTENVNYHTNLLKKEQKILGDKLSEKGLPVTSLEDAIHSTSEPMSKEEVLVSLEQIKSDLDGLKDNINDRDINN